MPHSLFLGSALATQDRISFRRSPDAVNRKEIDEFPPTKSTEKVSYLRHLIEESKEYILEAFRKPPASLYSTTATRYSERQNNPFEFVRAHVYHGTFDVVGSLLGFAVMINSLCVMDPFSSHSVIRPYAIFQDFDASLCRILLWQWQYWQCISCQSFRCL